MATECAVCYVSDIGFLLPSLISATRLRKFVPAHKADVYIFVIDQQALVSKLNNLLGSHDIRALSMESRAYSGFDPTKLNTTHAPAASLGRLCLENFLPGSCKRLVYLDGDTWIRRDPSALIEAVIPEGRFAAAEDMMYFRNTSFTAQGRQVKEYFGGLGIKREAGYFNAGVLAMSRDTWRAVTSDAYKFFLENTAGCKHLDQSALNAVANGRRLPLSLKWNFQSSFRYLGIEERIDPAIYHFSRFPKPWMGACEPWTDMYEPFHAATRLFDSLALPIKTLNQADIDAHNRAIRRKLALLRSPLGKLLSRCMGVDAYERRASRTFSTQEDRAR